MDVYGSKQSNKSILYSMGNAYFYLLASTAISFLIIINFTTDSNISPIPPILLMAIAYLATKFLFIKGKIKHPNSLLLLLSLKVFISALVYYFLWYQPLSNLGALFLENQAETGFQDAMFYQFHATQIAQLDPTEWWQASSVTWQSEGIILYLSAIFKLFGDAMYNVTFLNILLSYLSILLILSIGELGQAKFAGLAIILPHTLYYDIPPGKEALTTFLAYSTIASVYYSTLLRPPKQFVSVLLGASALILLLMVRANVALLLTFAIFISLIILHRGISSQTLIFSIVGVAIYFSAQTFFSANVESQIAAIGSGVDRLNEEDSSTKTKIVNIIYTESAIANLLFSPSYAVIWLLSPLPNLGLDLLYAGLIKRDSYAIYSFGPYFSRLAASIILLIMAFQIPIWSRLLLAVKAMPAIRYVFTINLILVIAISYNNLIQGARYRVIVEPIIWILFFASIDWTKVKNQNKINVRK